MDLKLNNKTVFISGSSKGIGFETAKLLLDEGARVIINGRTEDSVQSALEKLNTPMVSGIAADFIDNKQINELIKKLPDIDILVNNVGIFRGKLVSSSAKKVGALKIGPGMDKKSEMGPLVTKEHRT